MPIKTMNRIIPNVLNWLKLTMNAAKGSIRCLLASVLLAVAGCSTSRVADAPSTDAVHFQSMATQIEYPAGPTPCDGSLANTPPPRTIRDPSQVEYRDLRLQEVIQTALMNSRVLIDLGGTVLRARRASRRATASRSRRPTRSTVPRPR